jgi:hypothetical protein
MDRNEIQPGSVLTYSCWGGMGRPYAVTVVKVGPRRVKVKDHVEPIHEWWCEPRHLFPSTTPAKDGGR